ncbi:hypothetical protein JOB18_001916 [Solea senegalensis]|uniref:Secreted protein n=1 Tax=Solea senegalensis TaxID=28829 RepID=A0AAV6T2T0_SOLSE|nr:hypothetical protein JOB18_001916 [Solea senegalensis]
MHRYTEPISLYWLTVQRRRNCEPHTKRKHKKRRDTQEVNRGSLVVYCVIILCCFLRADAERRVEGKKTTKYVLVR